MLSAPLEVFREHQTEIHQIAPVICTDRTGSAECFKIWICAKVLDVAFKEHEIAPGIVREQYLVSGRSAGLRQIHVISVGTACASNLDHVLKGVSVPRENSFHLWNGDYRFGHCSHYEHLLKMFVLMNEKKLLVGKSFLEFASADWRKARKMV